MPTRNLARPIRSCSQLFAVVWWLTTRAPDINASIYAHARRRRQRLRSRLRLRVTRHTSATRATLLTITTTFTTCAQPRAISTATTDAVARAKPTATAEAGIAACPHEPAAATGLATATACGFNYGRRSHSPAAERGGVVARL